MDRIAGVHRGSIAAVVPAGPYRLSADAPAPRRSRIGSGGTTILSGKIRYEEFNTALENEFGYGQFARQGVFDKMRRTSTQVQRALWLLKLPILAADPEVEAGDTTPEDEEIAALVAYNLFELIPWQARMREALTMFEFGFSAFEALADVVDVPLDRFPRLRPKKAGRPKAGEVAPAILFTDFEPRPAKTVYQWVPRQSKPTQVEEMVQWIGASDGSFMSLHPRVPGDWLLRFTHDQEAGNFQGVSILRPLYKPWLMTDELETIDAIRHERQNCGIPVIELGPEASSDDDEDKAASILASLAGHEKAYVILPNGWKFRWDTSGQGQGTNIANRLEQLDRRIADGVLAGFMALGNGDTGSYALAETQADRHLDLITVGARYILGVLNHGSDGWSPVRRIVDWNYGPRSRYPKVCFKNLRSKDDWAQILPLLRDFLGAKALGPRPTYAMATEIVRRLNLPQSVLPPEDEFEPAAEPPVEVASAEPDPGEPPAEDTPGEGTPAPAEDEAQAAPSESEEAPE